MTSTFHHQKVYQWTGEKYANQKQVTGGNFEYGNRDKSNKNYP